MSISSRLKRPFLLKTAYARFAKQKTPHRHHPPHHPTPTPTHGILLKTEILKFAHSSSISLARFCLSIFKITQNPNPAHVVCVILLRCRYSIARLGFFSPRASIGAFHFRMPSKWHALETAPAPGFATDSLGRCMAHSSAFSPLSHPYAQSRYSPKFSRLVSPVRFARSSGSSLDILATVGLTIALTECLSQ